MSSSRYPTNSEPGPSSSSKRRRVDTLEPETAHERHQRLYALKRSYERGRPPPKPASKDELDVLKERHQCARSLLLGGLLERSQAHSSLLPFSLSLSCC